MIDLRDIDRDRICQLAKANLKLGTELWAYGSRVKGSNFEASDLDLVIKSNEQSGYVGFFVFGDSVAIA